MKKAMFNMYKCNNETNHAYIVLFICLIFTLEIITYLKLNAPTNLKAFDKHFRKKLKCVPDIYPPFFTVFIN